MTTTANKLLSHAEATAALESLGLSEGPVYCLLGDVMDYEPTDEWDPTNADHVHGALCSMARSLRTRAAETVGEAQWNAVAADIIDMDADMLRARAEGGR